MNKSALVACLASVLAIAGAAGSVGAQERPSADTLRPNAAYFGQEFNQRQLFSEPEKASDAYRESIKIAQCLATVDDSASLIGGPRTDDRDYAALTAALKGDQKNCLRNTTGGLPMMVGAALAEQRLRDMDVQWEDRTMSLNMDEAERFYLVEEDKASLDTIGRCVSVFSPGLAYKALDTEPGSDNEEKRFDALYRATPECGLSASPAGVPLPFQRAALAHALYRWMNRAN